MPLKRKKPSQDVIIAVLERKRGVIADAARALGVSRFTLYNWINRNKYLSRALEDIREGFIDLAESNAELLIRGIPKLERGPDGVERLVGWIEKPDAAMIRFVLSTKGRSRGYGEITSVEHSGNVHIEWHEEKTYIRAHESDSQADAGD